MEIIVSFPREGEGSYLGEKLFSDSVTILLTTVEHVCTLK